MIYNGQIKRADIYIQDHGLLTATLQIDYDGGTCGFGGWNLSAPTAAGKFIRKTLDVMGVTNWKDLENRYVRVSTANSGQVIRAIGHITEDRWFNPKEDMREAS